MKIVLSRLPESGWWKSGIPQYKDNPAMKKGQIPINSLLIKERDALIKAIQQEGHEIIELDFPKQFSHFVHSKFRPYSLRQRNQPVLKFSLDALKLLIHVGILKFN